MNNIRNITFGNLYSQSISRQTTIKATNPAFRGGVDTVEITKRVVNSKKGNLTKLFLAALGLFGLANIFKSKSRAKEPVAVENNSQLKAEPTVDEILNTKVETWEEFFQKINEIEALGENNMSDKKNAQILEIKKLNGTKTGKMDSLISVNSGIQQMNREIRLKQRANAAKQATLIKQTEKKDARNAKIALELEKTGILNIKRDDDKTLSFEQNGINYVLKNNSSEYINLYKVLSRSVNGDNFSKEIELNAVVNKKTYKCDWKPGKFIRITENLCSLMEDNPQIANDKYFHGLLNDYTSVMDAEEITAFLTKHKDLALKTERGKKCLDALKISNPDKYIEILTPSVLYKSEGGEDFLKQHSPESYIDLVTPEKLYKTEEGKALLKQYRMSTYDKLEELEALERKVDELVPPVETIRVINYNQKVKEAPQWIEGHWEVETDDKFCCHEVGKHWESGYYTSAVYTGCLEYEYNGKKDSIARASSCMSEKYLLTEIGKDINKKRENVRNELKKSYSYSKKARLDTDSEMQRVIDFLQPPVETVEVVDYKGNELTYKYNGKNYCWFGPSQEIILNEIYRDINEKRERIRKELLKSEGYDRKIKGNYNSEGKSIIDITLDWLQPPAESIEITEYLKGDLTYRYNGKLLCKYGSPFGTKEEAIDDLYNQINQDREKLRNKLMNGECIHKKEEPWIVGSWFGDKVCAPIGTDMSTLHVPTGTRLYYGPGDMRNGTVYRNPNDFSFDD